MNKLKYSNTNLLYGFSVVMLSLSKYDVELMPEASYIYKKSNTASSTPAGVELYRLTFL